jgi:hypothetical protein
VKQFTAQKLHRAEDIVVEITDNPNFINSFRFKPWESDATSDRSFLNLACFAFFGWTFRIFPAWAPLISTDAFDVEPMTRFAPIQSITVDIKGVCADLCGVIYERKPSLRLQSDDKGRILQDFFWFAQSLGCSFEEDYGIYKVSDSSLRLSEAFSRLKDVPAVLMVRFTRENGSIDRNMTCERELTGKEGPMRLGDGGVICVKLDVTLAWAICDDHAVCSFDGKLKRWDVKNDRVTDELHEHFDRVLFACYVFKAKAV